MRFLHFVKIFPTHNLATIIPLVFCNVIKSEDASGRGIIFTVASAKKLRRGQFELVACGISE